MALDHYYSAFEALADRATRSLEGPVERSERWHRELLEAATLAVRLSRLARTMHASLESDVRGFVAALRA